MLNRICQLLSIAAVVFAAAVVHGNAKNTHVLDPAAVHAVFAEDFGQWIAREAPLGRERYIEWREQLLQIVYRDVDPETARGREFVRVLAAVDDAALNGTAPLSVYLSVEAAALYALAATARPVGLAELMPWTAEYGALQELAKIARKKYEWR
jgi:hypothetical protein